MSEFFAGWCTAWGNRGDLLLRLCLPTLRLALASAAWLRSCWGKQEDGTAKLDSKEKGLVNPSTTKQWGWSQMWVLGYLFSKASIPSGIRDRNLCCHLWGCLLVLLDFTAASFVVCKALFPYQSIHLLIPFIVSLCWLGLPAWDVKDWLDRTCLCPDLWGKGLLLSLARAAGSHQTFSNGYVDSPCLRTLGAFIRKGCRILPLLALLLLPGIFFSQFVDMMDSLDFQFLKTSNESFLVVVLRYL